MKAHESHLTLLAFTANKGTKPPASSASPTNMKESFLAVEREMNIFTYDSDSRATEGFVAIGPDLFKLIGLECKRNLPPLPEKGKWLAGMLFHLRCEELHCLLSRAPRGSFRLPLAPHRSIKLSLTCSSGTLPLYRLLTRLVPAAAAGTLSAEKVEVPTALEKWESAVVSLTRNCQRLSRAVVSVTNSQLALPRLTLTAVLAAGLTETTPHLKDEWVIRPLVLFISIAVFKVHLLPQCCTQLWQIFPINFSH